MTPNQPENRSDYVVYIVDDDKDACESVAELVSEMGVRTEQFLSAEAFLEAYGGHRPACLVTDVRMLNMSGLELQERLVELGIDMSVVVLTAYADTPIIVRAIQNGAITLIEKPSRDMELWDAIRAGLAADVQNFVRQKEVRKIRKMLDTLTDAEREVLDGVMQGAPNKQIASRLDVSVRTIEVRRQSLYRKMEVDNVAELVKMVMKAEKL